MAESVVSFAIETLGTLLNDKIVFLKGVEEQVRKLSEELVTLKCFLKDADQKQDEDEMIRDWVSRMRDVGYDAEDAIEIFVSKMESIKRKPSLKRFAYFPMRIHYLNKVGKEIESIESRLSGIKESRERYGIKNLGEGTNVRAQELHILRRTSAYAEDKNIVGLEEKAASLVSQYLLKEDSRRHVVSITGMGGIGKTTLARKIYNHTIVQKEFSCRAWVCVSQKYNFREIMKSVIKQVESVTKDLLDLLEKMDDDDLKLKFNECLEGKRYLVVLDDMWQKECWDILEKVFPNESKGNRLLLTTRNKSVAQHADPLYNPYELETLGEKESWELFVKNAFNDGECPSNLENVGREIVSKCGGLPLAIEAMGSLLLQKKGLQSEWEKVLEDIRSHLSSRWEGVSPILELSYRDLPLNLKFCFNYLGLFPEDREIGVKKLIRLWIAEGIVLKSDGAKCLEDIAADYVEQLINRNMVQVAYLTFDERVMTIRLHDLLRDVAIKKGRDENFVQIPRSNERDDKTSIKSRYLAVYDCPFSGYLTPRLRTFLFFPMAKDVEDDWFSFGGIRLIRVLDLEDVDIRRLPKQIGEMSLLRYLGLSVSCIRKVPRSLGQLQRLQTLRIVGNGDEVEIPNVIWKLQCLRHLYLVVDSGSLKIEGLKSLRTLLIMGAVLINNNLVTLTSLQELTILIKQGSEIDILCTSLSKLGNFRSLNLYCCEPGGFPSLDRISDISHLSELMLDGKLTMLPPLPTSLSRLFLQSTCLEDDPMPMLAKLERLSSLTLWYTYRGKEMTIPSNGFYQLNFLELHHLPHLEEVTIEKAAMRKLKCLRIKECENLKMLPEELKSVTSVEKLELVKMPTEFLSRLEGPDQGKVRGIPTVRIL